MRIDVKKFLFYGTEAVRSKFFEEAQQAGIVEFIDPEPSAQKEASPEIQAILSAIKVVRGLPTTEQEESTDYSQADRITKEILELHEREDQLEEALRVLSQEMARVDIFGDFSLEDLEWIQEHGNRKVQFFAAKKDAEFQGVPQGSLIFVGSDHGLDYYVSVHPEPIYAEGLLEMTIDEPLGVLQKKKERAQYDLVRIEKRLKEYAKYHDYLHEALTDHYNSHNLQSSLSYVSHPGHERLFVVQGWVAVNKLDQLSQLTSNLDVAYDEIAFEDSDRVPTYLENEGFARIGEDLVHIYDTPSTEDKDPSNWVLWSFALFFAIILGDGGYGLIFLAMALFLRMKFPSPKPGLKRVLTLFTVLSISCVTWGVLTNSFFGISFDIDSSVRQVSGLQWLVERKADYHLAQQDGVFQKWVERFPEIASAETGEQMLRFGASERDGSKVFQVMDSFADGIMLELALLIGVIHVALSMLRSIRGAWAGLGWIAFMAGGYLYVPQYLDCTSMVQFLGGVDRATGAAAGTELLTYGLGGAVVLALIQHRLGGLGEIINVIQVFADVLSYLRLYALGLAGAMMSSTFNQIGASVPVVAGILVILIGHTVNIVLSVMGGVIHGLRLNFLEWYHYSFEGGGKMFRPLALLRIKY